MKIVLLTE